MWGVVKIDTLPADEEEDSNGMPLWLNLEEALQTNSDPPKGRTSDVVTRLQACRCPEGMYEGCQALGIWLKQGCHVKQTSHMFSNAHWAFAGCQIDALRHANPGCPGSNLLHACTGRPLHFRISGHLIE